MFMRTELVLLNKIDLLPYLDFDVEEARRDLSEINPLSSLLPLSARTQEGLHEWFSWIEGAYERCVRP